MTVRWHARAALDDRGSALAVLVPPDLAQPLDSPRPVIHPLVTPGGTVVSDLSPDDHSWHRGLSFVVSNLRVDGEALPVNLWGGVTWHEGEYRQLDNNGDQRVVSESGEGSVHRSVLEWRTRGGRALLREDREIAASVGVDDASRRYLRLRWSSMLTNLTSGELGFGSPTTAGRPAAGYGGLFLRAAPAFAGADVLMPAGPIEEAAAMGAEARWMALRSADATVAIAARSGSTPWFVRSTPHPMLCAAPFFHAETGLAGGDHRAFGWDVLVTDAAWTPGDVERALRAD